MSPQKPLISQAKLFHFPCWRKVFFFDFYKFLPSCLSLHRIGKLNVEHYWVCRAWTYKFMLLAGRYITSSPPYAFCAPTFIEFSVFCFLSSDPEHKSWRWARSESKYYFINKFLFHPTKLFLDFSRRSASDGSRLGGSFDWMQTSSSQHRLMAVEVIDRRQESHYSKSID